MQRVSTFSFLAARMIPPHYKVQYELSAVSLSPPKNGYGCEGTDPFEIREGTRVDNR